MRKKRVTLKYLEKEVWWWRPGANNHPAEFNPTDTANPLAFNYELARRAERLRCLAPFTALNRGHHSIIRPWLGKLFVPQIPWRYAGNESQENEKGWTRVRPKLQWNLNASERDLTKAFLDFIRQERGVQGIPPPVRTEKRRRLYSWAWPELMDLHDFKIRPLANNERSSWSMAQKEADRQLELFDEALDSYWEQHDHDHGEEDPEMLEFVAGSPVDFELKNN